MTFEISLRAVEGLKSAAPTPHLVSEGHFRQLSSTVAARGFAIPVLIDTDGLIVAGYGRVEAAKALGISEIPCLSVDDMSEADKQAYFLAHHRLAIQAGWDEELLASELYETPIPLSRPGSAPIRYRSAG